jgi:ribose 1,5-bisphosphokinase PhnN
MAMKRKITAKKKASPEKIKQRAEKQAKDIIRKKLAKDQDYNKMSYAAKIALDKKVEKKKAVIKKLSKKLIPKVKTAEPERIKKLKDKKANEATAS